MADTAGKLHAESGELLAAGRQRYPASLTVQQKTELSVIP
jgi:hypothetical protein